MNFRVLLTTAAAALMLAGCTTYRGGTADDWDQAYPSDRTYQADPGPAASPSFRPGMNTRDPRDPTRLTDPFPYPRVSPPVTE